MQPLGKSFLFEKRTIICLSVFTLIGGIFFGYITSEIKNFSGVQNLKQFQPALPTKLFDVNGELVSELYQEKRDLVSYAQIPRCTINAFLATEDQDFYQHFGINPAAIGRAAIKNIAAMKIVQGGSTITQQLAKRLFTKGEKRFTRKILEVILAMQIEKQFSKDEILEMYFNQIYLGHGCYGISSAADLYFGKKVKYLTVAESSVLAALPSSPEDLSPLKDTHAAYEKNRDILSRMVGQKYLTKEKADKLYAEFWPAYVESIRTEYPTKTVHSRNDNNAPHFTDYVRQILIARYGKDVVYNEGLNVFTTLDLKRQLAAEKYLYEGTEQQDRISSQSNKYINGMVDRGLFGMYYDLSKLFSLPGVKLANDPETIQKIQTQKYITENIIDESEILTSTTIDIKQNAIYDKFRGGVVQNLSSSQKVQGAFLAVEPKTGYITSMVGGASFEVNNQYNRATQAHRQPGSSFKPFVYGAGIDSKIINAGTALPDAPIVDIDAAGESWAPENYEGDYNGLVRLRQALMKSINIISVRIFDAVGADRIINYASKMLKVSPSRFTPTPSLALGSTEMTPFEMANGYAIYANRGRDVIPYAVRYVVDRDGNEMANIEEEVGNIIAIKEKEGSIQIIGEDVAFVMTSLMQSVCDGGTASYGIRSLANFQKKCAGKTGTTSNWTDAWFCGFTPDIAAVCWIGYDKPFLSLGRDQAGAGVAAPIWGRYMKDAYNGMPDPEFPPAPEGVTMGGVCSFTGLAPGPTCPVVGEYMIKGGYPAQKCDGNHQKMQSVKDLYLEKAGITTKHE
jgi:penicillin-binding protein 1A